jgi:hypothetical protein
MKQQKLDVSYTVVNSVGERDMKLLMALHLTNLMTHATDRTREGVFQSDMF